MAIITPKCTDFAWGCAPRPRLDGVLITTRQDPASREVHPCVTDCVGPQLRTQGILNRGFMENQVGI